MTTIRVRPEHRRSTHHRIPARHTAAAVAGSGALLVLIYGGYAHHWAWTGINGDTATLWDWLHLLLLPLAAGILPIALRRRGLLHTPATRQPAWPR